MLEVEQKYRLADSAAVRERLAKLQIQWHQPLEQIDRYFNHPARDYGQTDEALRLRRVGERNWITYKGPKLDATTKTRHELELSLPDGCDIPAQYTELLTLLGFRQVREVAKLRTPGELFHDGLPVEAALDEVAGLGIFLELELLVQEPQLEAAKAVLADLATRLQLGKSERRSYLELLLEAGP